MYQNSRKKIHMRCQNLLLSKASTMIRRSFASATEVLSSTANLTGQFTKQSLDLYKKNKVDVDKELDKYFNANKIVVFMEGTMDAPKSLLSNNLVKILTGVQTFPLVSVDVLEHPAILGYTVHRSGSHCTPHVYVNGTFYGDYDMVASKFKSGELSKLSSETMSKSEPLPVGMF